MANDDLHSLSFNLPSSIGSTSRIPILVIEDYEVWALHFENYILGIEEHGSTIWHAMTTETYKYSLTKKEVKTKKDYDEIIADNPANDKKIKLMCTLKAMRII